MKSTVDHWKRREIDDLINASKVALSEYQGQCNNLFDRMDVMDAKKKDLRRSCFSVMTEESNEEQTSKTNNASVDICKLNIGGKCVDIHRSTLTLVPSRLAWMMSGRWDHCFPRDRTGRLFLDLDYEWFAPIVSFLREMAEQEEDGPSDYDDPLSFVVSGSMGQMEVIRWLKMDFLVDGWTPPSTKRVSPPMGATKSSKLGIDEVFGNALAAVEEVEKDFNDEVEFMTNLMGVLGQESRQTLLHFNVGGIPFTVSKHTISQAQASKLWVQYCSGRWEVQDRELDQDGSIFLDMDPDCFGKIISCLRLAALVIDRGCDIHACPSAGGVVVEASQRRCFDRMVAYLQIEETVFDGILERVQETPTTLRKIIRTFSKQLTEWVGTPRRTWEVLYRGSRDGFSPGTFHAACERQKDTIVVIQDTNNSVFGGYSSDTWLLGTLGFETSGGFLFSLSRDGVLDQTAAKKCEFIGRSGQAAMYYARPPGRAPSNGCLTICDYCDTRNYSSIYLDGDIFENHGDPFLLTGGANFTVQEIEVYATRQ